jgi:hypothetical protein
MKKYLFLIYLFPIYLCSQNYENVKVKEYYDANLESVNENVMPAPLMEFLVADGNNDDLFGDRISKVLSSLLTMYETTGDKAYLIKFIQESICMQEMRQDTRGESNRPIWNWQSLNAFYQDGLVCGAMMHLVYLVKNEPSFQLNNIALPQINNIAINDFNIPFQTFGQYADWLRSRVDMICMMEMEINNAI